MYTMTSTTILLFVPQGINLLTLNSLSITTSRFIIITSTLQQKTSTYFIIENVFVNGGKMKMNVQSTQLTWSGEYLWWKVTNGILRQIPANKEEKEKRYVVNIYFQKDIKNVMNVIGKCLNCCSGAIWSRTTLHQHTCKYSFSRNPSFQSACLL